MARGDAGVTAAGGLALEVPRLAADSASAVLGVRPEHVEVDAQGPIAARIEHVEYFGSHWIAALDTPLGALKAVLPRELRPRGGDRLAVRLRTERLVLFDRATTRRLPSTSQPEAAHG